MRKKQLLWVAIALMALVVPVNARSIFTVTGPWSEVFGPGGEGSAGGTIAAGPLTDGSWTVNLPQAVHQGVTTSYPDPVDPNFMVYVTDYVVNPAMPVTISGPPWSGTFSNLTLTVTSYKRNGTFEMAGSAMADPGPADIHMIVISATGQGTFKTGNQAGDTQGGTMTATIELHWRPAAANDAYSTNEDTALVVAAPGVLANDTDNDGDPLTAVLDTGVANGALTFNADGSFTYTPSANWSGSDSFTYHATDGKVDSLPATVTITVAAVNDAPVAANDAYSMAATTVLVVPAPGVLANDTDIEGDPLTAVLNASVLHGTLVLNADGSFTYTPTPYYAGPDTFTYHANDGSANSNVATVSITVTGAAPWCSTFEAKNIKETSAKFYGDVIEDGGLRCEYRFVYWPEGGAPIATAWMGSLTEAEADDVAGYVATNLIPGTIYHYRIDVRNAAGEDDGNVRDFVTTARLAISSEPHGSVVTPGEGVFLGTRGKSLDIVAQAGPGYVFGGWTGSAVDAGLVKKPAEAATSVKYDGDQTLVATFNAKILWVSFHATDANASAGAVTAGFVEAPDRAYTDLLSGAGYVVERFVTTNTPDVNVLNAAALVIIGRSVSSGNFQNERATLWNTQVTVPVINTGGYTLRKNRTGFSTGNTIPDIVGDVKLTATMPDHPIFAGISLTDGTMDANFAGICMYPDGVTLAKGISVNTNPVDPNGLILATLSAQSGDVPAGAMIIAEWPAGVVVKHDGGGLADVLAARRMVFLTGSREASGKNSEGTGMMDLTDEGQQIFLNAVEYMLLADSAPVAVVNPSFEDPNAGKIKGWNGEGVAGTPAVDIPGWASDGAAADSGVEQGWGATDGTWSGFIMNGDPFVYQLTGYVVQAGDVLNLKVDAKNNWAATKFLMTLYYDEAGARMPLATREVDLTDAMQTFSLWFSAAAAPDCVGKQLGIELANSSSPDAPGTTWMGLDRVSLSVMAVE
ncbi:MAG: tandem-95 repeat protein [Phycisphaerae bacterium]|nr:tandem-95 repeat protein [Phycisphaerae bacterium]